MVVWFRKEKFSYAGFEVEVEVEVEVSASNNGPMKGTNNGTLGRALLFIL